MRETEREAGRIKISQQTYVEELAEQYGVRYDDGIPLSAACKLWDFDPEEPDVDHPFRELIGALLWIARLTRPDILNAVSSSSEVLQFAEDGVLEGRPWILGSTVRTKTFGISFQRGTTVEGFSLVAFCDADYASRAADRRSTSRGVIMCAGGAVFCFSKTQRCVTLSTTQR